MNRAQLIAIDAAAALSRLNVDSFCVSLTAAFTDANNGFTTLQRQAAFIGQLCVESAHFQKVVENLNYSAQGLLLTFPKHFDANTANTYAHNPTMIANRVYANRMGNGLENSGDGWKYRGRGLIQITGKLNYTLCHKDLGIDCINNPDLLFTEKGAVDSAVWFYSKLNNLNQFADTQDIVSITKVINGGTNGLADRVNYFNKALVVLSHNP